MNYVRRRSLPSNDFMSSIILQFMLVHVFCNSHTAVEKTFSGLKVIVRLHVFLFYDFLSQIITFINLVDIRCKLLSSFKPRGAGYESVHYGIINTRSMQSVRAY